MALKRKVALGCRVFAGLLAVTVAGTSVIPVGAAAAPRVTFAEAWRLCKEQLDREKIPGTMTSNDRYLRGGACMANFGYRL